MDLEKILEKAQLKAKKIANKIERALQKNDQVDIQELETRLTDRLPLKEISSEPDLRLTIGLVVEVYAKTTLKPGKSTYWFSEDFPKNPLIQISTLNKEKAEATPIAAYCTLLRTEILSATRVVPEYVKENSSFTETPSNQWMLGQISQLTGLSISYILGFNLGYDGRNPSNSFNVCLQNGFDDGRKIREHFLNQKLIEEDFDQFELETNSNKIDELFRIGYYTEENIDVSNN